MEAACGRGSKLPRRTRRRGRLKRERALPLSLVFRQSEVCLDGGSPIFMFISILGSLQEFDPPQHIALADARHAGNIQRGNQRARAEE